MYPLRLWRDIRPLDSCDQYYRRKVFGVDNSAVTVEVRSSDVS